MFEKRKDSSPIEPSAGEPSEKRSERVYQDTFNARNTAVIGATIKIKGDVTGDENLVIEGKVEGSIKLSGHDLTIGQNGQVDADLSAKTVKVEGQITGDIKGSEKVIITKSGRVLGNIVAPRVTLEDGAKFKGSIDMDPSVEKPVTSAAPKQASSSAKAVPQQEKSSQSGG